MDLRDLLHIAAEHNASDLHITEGAPPIVRIDGELIPLDYPPLTREDTKRMVYGVLNDAQKVKFEENLELDFSLYIPEISRFRVNVHQQKGCVEAAFRSNHPGGDGRVYKHTPQVPYHNDRGSNRIHLQEQAERHQAEGSRV